MGKDKKKAGKNKWVYFFGKKYGAEGYGLAMDILGGKGIALAEMIKIGLPGLARQESARCRIHRVASVDRRRRHRCPQFRAQGGQLGAAQYRKAEHGPESGRHRGRPEDPAPGFEGGPLDRR